MQYLIGHSHGGNVSLYAARQTKRGVEGIACWATPFIHVAVRSGNVFSGRLVHSGVFGVLGIAGSIALMVIDWSLLYFVPLFISTLIVLMVSGAIFGIAKSDIAARAGEYADGMTATVCEGTDFSVFESPAMRHR